MKIYVTKSKKYSENLLKLFKKKGFKVKKIDAKGNFVERLKKIKPKYVFNALHGKFGEDGFIQIILESLKIPYTHSGVYASSLAMDKELSRVIFKKNKFKVPKYLFLKKHEDKNLLYKLKKKTFQATLLTVCNMISLMKCHQ